MASDDPRRERAVPVGTAHAFVFPHHNRPGTIHAEDVESSGYSWVRYATPADLPNFFTGNEGNHITVSTGVTVARSDAGVGFYKCCNAPKYEQIWTWNVYGPDSSGNPTVPVQTASNHQTTETSAIGSLIPCWDGLFCGATSVDFLPAWTLGCTWKLGNYKSEVVYQSRDRATDALSTPAVIFQRTWTLGYGVNALTITADRAIVHPASVHTTGGQTYPRFPGGVAHIRLLAKDCGQIPPRPVQITLTPTVVSHSAGHNHNPPALDEVATFDRLSCTSDPTTGACSIIMTAQGVSSLLKLRAHIDDFDTTDNVISPVDSSDFNMAVAIPGLQQMAFDTSIVFPSGINTTHPDNHNAQPEMISFIYLFAKDYQDDHNGDRIRIDDMSLPLGGNFDIDASYDPDSHAFHRFGIDVDVSRHIVKPDGTLVLNDLQVVDLTTYIRVTLNGSKYPEGPIHYRFPANGIDEIIRTRILP